MDHKQQRLEWQLRNALEWSSVDPATRSVLEAWLKAILDYVKN